MTLTNIYRTIHPKATEYRLLKNTQNILKDRFMLGHKTSFNKFKNIEIIVSIFTNHNEIKLEIIAERKTVKFTNM